jgi:hypothetical protein
MSHIIDVRYSGRELVVLGDRVVLPASTDGTEVAPVLNAPPLGSLRRNITSNSLEFFTTAAPGQPATWQSVLTQQQSDGRYLMLAGGTISGNVTINADTTVNGVLRATFYDGVALQAQYAADLAERYHADEPYEPGTVVVIGGPNEVTACTRYMDLSVAGIVSTKPAYGMNLAAGSDETHPLIALKGRVPCKVVGTVRKGEILVTSPIRGHAQAAHDNLHPSAVIGRALADKWDIDPGLVEVMV